MRAEDLADRAGAASLRQGNTLAVVGNRRLCEQIAELKPELAPRAPDRTSFAFPLASPDLARHRLVRDATTCGVPESGGL